MSKTMIYIDGYNLYYSRLKGTPYKWLDVCALFRDQILRVQDPTAQVISVKYFTAPVKASYARHGTASVHAQDQYHRALTAKHGDLIQIIKGFHIFGPRQLPTYLSGKEADKSHLSEVWMIEEKQTDVNLALQFYRDAANNSCDQLVICTNDSDLEPALEMVTQDFPHLEIGLVLPLHDKSENRGVVPNKRLTKRANWVRRHILDTELASAQFPQHVPTKRKPASKPAHW